MCLSLLRSEHPQPARARPGGSRDKGNPGAVSRSQPGENRGEEAPISPSPAAAELGSRVAEHVIHGRKLEIKGEERARARCHPKLLPKVRKGGGEITPPTHMLAHPKDPALLVGAQGGRIHQDALRYAPRLKQRQARLNKKKKTKTTGGAFLPIGFQSRGSHTRPLPKQAKRRMLGGLRTRLYGRNSRPV